MKAADILKAHHGPATGSVGAYWKSRVSLREDGAYQKPLTGKEAGQLKQLQAYLGDQTKPVIAYAVEHWWTFAHRAAAAAGTSCPVDPNIGFLLKHHAVAVNLLMPDVRISPIEEKPVQSIATGTDDDPIQTLTSQELTALLEGLKSP